MKVFLDLDGPVLDVSLRYYRVFLDICRCRFLDKDKFWELRKKQVSWEKIFEDTDVFFDKNKFLKLWLSNIEKKKYLKLDKVQNLARKALYSLHKHNQVFLVSLRQSKVNLFWQVRQLRLDKYFTKIIHCRHAVDAPWSVKAGVIRKNLSAGEPFFVIGDTEVDIRAAKSLGIKSIGVINGIRTKEFLAEEKPDFLVKDIKGAVELAVKHG